VRFKIGGEYVGRAEVPEVVGGRGIEGPVGDDTRGGFGDIVGSTSGSTTAMRNFQSRVGRVIRAHVVLMRRQMQYIPECGCAGPSALRLDRGSPTGPPSATTTCP
jgi:hypothetical protein